VRASCASGDPFAFDGTRATAAEKLALIFLLIVAAFLRLYWLSDVPPGIHDDEVINAQIVDRVRMGAPCAIFYTAGEGREGLYHLLLIASRTLTARVPHWYRLPSVGCSMLTVFLVQRLSRRWFGPWAALVAMGGLSVGFWSVFLGREALRVVTLPPIAAGLLLAFWRGLERPVGDRRAIAWFALAGVLLGLSQYTYLAARVLPLFVVLFAVYLACFHRARWRAHWRGLVLMLVLGALIAAPLAAYLEMHWGEQERIGRLGEPLQALLAGDPRPVLHSTAATLGMFVWRGDPQPHYNVPGRPVFGPAGGTLFVIGVAIMLFGLRRPASACCLIWTVVLLLPGMLTQPAPHFVRTAGTLVTAFVFPGVAVQWMRERLRHLPTYARGWRVRQNAPVLLAAALVALLGVNSGLTFRDYFHRWAALDDVRNYRHADLADASRYLDQEEDVTPVAVCTPFLNEGHFFWRSDRQALPYLLNRRDLDIGWYNCQDAQLFPRGGQAARYLFGDDAGFAPFVPIEWNGQARFVAAPGNSRLLRAEVVDQLEAYLDQLTPAASGALPAASPQTFGGTMAFLGYRVETTTPVPAGDLEILTAWRVLATPPYDLAIFVHLLDDAGDLVGQGDALSALSDTFHPGDVFVQRHIIALPEGLLPGDYRLLAGLYVRGGERLPLDAGEGDSLTLGAVEVHDAGD